MDDGRHRHADEQQQEVVVEQPLHEGDALAFRRGARGVGIGHLETFSDGMNLAGAQHLNFGLRRFVTPFGRFSVCFALINIKRS